jgi:glycosyltransferase involved in cell wall biosynthesis
VKRALLVAHYASPHVGGLETVVDQQAQSLTERGYDVRILTCRHDRSVPARSSGPYAEVLRSRAFNGFARRGVTFPVVSPLFFLRALREVRRADLVHLHDVFYTTSHLAALALLLTGRPFTLTQHVALVDHPSRLVMAVQRLVYRTVGRPILRRARGIVVYNTNVRDHLLGLGVPADKILLTHNGIDTARFTPAAPEEKHGLRSALGLPADLPVVLFVGRMVPKKGADLVAATADGATRTTVLVGDGDAPPAGPGVVVHGPARGQELVDLYRAADVFVFPAVGEIFTLVMQEAMACGLPVVTYDDPGYASYDLDRERIALVPRDVPSLRKAVDEVLADPQRREAMGRWSRATAEERFSWAANYEAQHAVHAR